ncbi:MAG: hypothetical protein M3347_02600, partial [Armatimonadota bacterium]|nr:hypothetical protein [Armatimonadota bacterium]
VDPQGRVWNKKDNRDSGGVAYVTIDIVHATPDFIAADVRSYLIAENNLPTATGGYAFTGNADAFGNPQLTYWMHPARLARLREGREAGQTINRLRYEINNQTYDAVSLTTHTEKIFESEIYDLKTGLLLSSSRSYRGDSVPVATAAGTMGAGQGATVISHARLIGSRQLNLPWADDPAPQWATPGRQLDYQGSKQSLLQGSSLPPLPASPMAVSFSIDRVVGECALVKMTTRSETGSGLPPQQSTNDRCYGSASLVGLWISPNALRQLQPNQVIDQDSLTQRRVVYLGLQGNAAVFMDQGPLEATYNSYDPQSGMLVGFQSTHQMANIGQQQTQLQLMGTR